MSNRIKIPKEALGPAGTVMYGAKTIGPELCTLKALNKATGGVFNPGYVSFSFLTKRTRKPRKAVRRHCRWLRHHGLAKYAKGLFNEDGEVAGAGYAITTEGKAVLRYLKFKALPKHKKTVTKMNPQG